MSRPPGRRSRSRSAEPIGPVLLSFDSQILRDPSHGFDHELDVLLEIHPASSLLTAPGRAKGIALISADRSPEGSAQGRVSVIPTVRLKMTYIPAGRPAARSFPEVRRNPELGVIMESNLLGEGEFLGTVCRKASVAGVRLVETSYAPGCRLPEHAHTRPYLCLVVSGAYTEHFGRSRHWDCLPGNVIFHPPNISHANRFAAAIGRCFNAELGESWIERATEAPARLEAPVHLPYGPGSSLAFRLHQELRRPDDLSSLVVEGLVMALLGQVARSRLAGASRAAPGWMERCRDLLRARFAETLTLDEVAAAVGVHPAHLSRAFRAHEGCTVGEYVRQLRVEFVRRALESGETPLSEIAFAAGFSDQSHLTRTFRILVGMTPARYRQAVRGR